MKKCCKCCKWFDFFNRSQKRPVDFSKISIHGNRRGTLIGEGVHYKKSISVCDSVLQSTREDWELDTDKNECYFILPKEGFNNHNLLMGLCNFTGVMSWKIQDSQLRVSKEDFENKVEGKLGQESDDVGYGDEEDFDVLNPVEDLENVAIDDEERAPILRNDEEEEDDDEDCCCCPPPKCNIL